MVTKNINIIIKIIIIAIVILHIFLFFIVIFFNIPCNFLNIFLHKNLVLIFDNYEYNKKKICDGEL